MKQAVSVPAPATSSFSGAPPAALPPSARAGDEHQLLWLTLLGVMLAFVGAAFWSHQRHWLASAASGLGWPAEGVDAFDSALGEDAGPESGSDSATGRVGTRRSGELPFAGRPVAPLPKTGSNAPLLYVDAPPRRPGKATSSARQSD